MYVDFYEKVAPSTPPMPRGCREVTFAVGENVRETVKGGPEAAARKDRLFDDRALSIALERLTQSAPETLRANRPYSAPVRASSGD